MVGNKQKIKGSTKLLIFLAALLSILLIVVVWAVAIPTVNCGENQIKFHENKCCDDYNGNNICDDMEDVMNGDFEDMEGCYEDLIDDAIYEINDCSDKKCSLEMDSLESEECLSCFQDIHELLRKGKKDC